MTERKVEQKSSLKITDVGTPKKLLEAMHKDEKRRVVGFIHGFCNDTVTRSSPDGLSSNTGMLGQFEIIPSDVTMPVVRSGICYLGDEYQPPVIAVLKVQAGADGKGQITGVSFIYEIAIERNAHTFKWALSMLGDPESLDPLSATRAKVAGYMKPVVQEVKAAGKGK